MGLLQLWRVIMKLLICILLLFSLQTSKSQEYGWVEVAKFGNPYNYLITVDFIDSLHGLVGGPAGFYLTTNGGLSWTYCKGQPMPPSSISMHDSLIGWAAGWVAGNSTMFRTTDGGTSWSMQRYQASRIYKGTATQSSLMNTTVGWTSQGGVPDTGIVIRTTDAGLTWIEQVPDPNIQQLLKVQYVDSLNGWILSESSKMLRTSNGGSTWETLSIPSIFSAMFFRSVSVGFAVSKYAGSGTAAICYRTKDAGTSWEQLGALD